MRKLIIPCLIIQLVSASLVNVMAKDVLQDRLLINANVSLDGPYDGMWEVEIKEFDDFSGAEVDFSRTDGRKMSLQGNTILSQEELKPLKLSIIQQKFFELPKDIIPTYYGFHTPIYELNICFGNKCHEVSLDNPENTINESEHQRFRVIWDLVMKSMPKWPNEWPLVIENK